MKNGDTLWKTVMNMYSNLAFIDYLLKFRIRYIKSEPTQAEFSLFISFVMRLTPLPEQILDPL